MENNPTITFRIMRMKLSLFNKFIDMAQKANIKYRVSRQWNDKRKYAISMYLEEGLPNSKVLDFILKEKILISNYGIYINFRLLTTRCSLKLSNEALNFYNKFGGTIDFSYTYFRADER